MMVHGGDHPARAMRLMIRDLARGRQGVAEAGDLKVRPLATPGPGVRVGDGSAIVHGARPWQGAYTQANIGDAIVEVLPTGPYARTDLLVLRIEDPEFEGDRDPRHEDVGYFHLIQGIDPRDTTAVREMTAIPLARITIPRNTAAITAEMISDLRRLANPRAERTLRTLHPKPGALAPAEHGRWTAWPKDATWTVEIPAWATKAAVVLTVTGLRIEGGSVYVEVRTVLGDHNGAPTVIDDDQGTSARRTTAVLADSFDVPAHYRGTRQQLTVQINQNDKYGHGNVSAAAGTAVVADVEFTESPI